VPAEPAESKLEVVGSSSTSADRLRIVWDESRRATVAETEIAGRRRRRRDGDKLVPMVAVFARRAQCRA
jgi:hypothetical protein